MHYDHFHRCCPAKMPARFTHFQKLPAEIRLMIWEYSLPEPRVYEVLDAPNAKQRTPAQEGLMFANLHPEPPPALAAVCHESRFFVLKHYKPLTLGRTTKFVDLSRDILLLEPYLLVKRLHRTLRFLAQIPLVRDTLARLALGTSYGLYTGICHPVLSWRVSKNNVGKLLTALARFAKMRTLILVVHQEFQFEFDFRFPHPAAAAASLGMGAGVGAGIAAGLYQQPYYGHPLLAPPMMQSLPTHHGQLLGVEGLVGTGGLEVYGDEGLPSRRAQMMPPRSQPGIDHRSPPGIPPQRLPHPGATGSPLHPPLREQPQRQPQLSPSDSPRHHHHHPQHHQELQDSDQSPLPYSRPQLVHQAYRFKFDIESNINHMPRRPHFNELLYYPLDIDEDKDDDWDLAATGGPGDPFSDNYGAGGGGGSGGGGGGHADEWCDPWPTNDDWRRFRRRFQRAINVSLEMGGQAKGGGKVGDGEDERCAGKGEDAWDVGYGMGRCPGGFGGGSSLFGGGSIGASGGGGGAHGFGPSKDSRTGKGKNLKLRAPELKGASLLWRYTRGGYV